MINNSINLTANVTATLGVSVVKVNVTWPNGTTTTYPLPNIVFDMYGNGSAVRNASQFGRYNVTYIANDTQNFVNDTERTNFTIIPPNVLTVYNFGEDAASPYDTYNRTPMLNVTLDETGDCRMAEANRSYDDMSADIDCLGDGTLVANCTTTSDLSLGFHNFFVSCRDTVGNKDTEKLNQNYTIEIVARADCNLNTSFRYVVFGELGNNESNATDDDAPFPLRIRNDGNVVLNISLNATDLWTTNPNPTRNYSYMIDNVSSGAWTAAENDTWRPLQRLLTAANVSVRRLKYKNSSNENADAEIELNITSPVNEEAGDKESIVDVFCLSAE